MGWGGGFANDPHDSGGATFRGITIGTYTHYCKLKGKPALWTPTEYFLLGLEHDGKRFKSIQDAKDAILLNEDRTKRFLNRNFTKTPLKHCVYVIYYLKSKLDEYHKDTEVVDVIPVFYKTKEDFENENNVKIDELITFDQPISH